MAYLEIGRKKDIFSIYNDENNTFLGTFFGLYKFELINGKPSYSKVFDETDNKKIKDSYIFDIEKDDDNHFFLGTSKGLFHININTKSSNLYTVKNSNISNDYVYKVFKANNNWWVGTEDGLNKLISFNDSGAVFKTYHPNSNKNSIGGRIIHSIEKGYGNDLWIGTYDGGLSHFNIDDETFKSYSVKDGLSNNAIYGILRIDSSIWMSTNRGISSYNIPKNNFVNYYESDGLQSNEFNVGAYYKSKYDELFFGGINGVSHFYPSNLKENKTPPHLSFTDIIINNKPLKEIKGYEKTNINEINTVELEYYNNNIKLNFSALHFTNSAKNSYRFYIEESKDSNILITNNGLANYTRLSPGEYNFIAYAANADGIWSKTPLKLKIIINPPFWASWWFRTIGIVLTAILIFSYFWFRVQNIKRQKAILEHLVKKRTKTISEQKEKIEIQKAEIEKEKEKADDVLHKIFPDRIAKKLKNKGKIKAELYEETSIMFADFVKFSTISKKLSPEDLIGQLNKYFKVFDRIIIRNNLFQIKTIGDAYMTVGGIPKNKTNAVDATLAGLQIQEYMNRLAKKDETTWKIRIGINTGEIVAGVLETKRPLYDIWGSAVNIASRLQDESKPGKVNVSESTYKHIKPYFDCSARGGILTKNVGVISMYFVNGIKPMLSQKGEGVLPNAKFHSYLETNIKTKLKYNDLEKYFIKFLRDNLSDKLYYHSVYHTIDVINAVENIALNENIFDERVIILKTAALIHDAGFVKQYDDNEPVGVEYAKEILPGFGFNQSQVDQVAQLILATAVTYSPKNKLEKIIKDADLDYLGRSDFEEISDKLFRELFERDLIKDKEDWDKKQVSFFEQHRYYTNYSKKNRILKKKTNKPKLVSSKNNG